MPKKITAPDLAEIVTGLLLKPEMMNALETPNAQENFMRDIGRVVAEYCGGEIETIDSGITSPVHLVVVQNERLPSLQNNVWSYHDIDGWKDEAIDGVKMGEPVTLDDSKSARRELQAALINAGRQLGDAKIPEE